MRGSFYPICGGEMGPKKNKARLRLGVTLIEILVAMAALAIAVLGTSYFRYYSALDARKANIQIAGTRAGLLLCESWKGLKGTETYDPVACFSADMTIIADSTIPFSSGHAITGPVVDEGFTELGTYAVTVNGITYHAVLSWKDVSAGLRALNIIIVWELLGREVTGATDVSRLRSFNLTTYTST
jgi:prepilin-type N-terminal cleavage/methylation domain-containing protein